MQLQSVDFLTHLKLHFEFDFFTHLKFHFELIIINISTSIINRNATNNNIIIIIDEFGIIKRKLVFEAPQRFEVIYHKTKLFFLFFFLLLFI